MPAEKPMRVTIRSTDVQRNFRDVVNRAGSGQEHIIVERDGLPVIAMLSMAEYETLMREREQYERDKQLRLKKFQEAARSIGQEMERLGLSEDEMEQLVEETRQQLHEEQHGNQPAT